MRQTAGYNETYKEVMKESLVWEASGHRTASLSELYRKYPKAYSLMIEQMKGDRSQRQQRYEDEADTARKRVIAAIAKDLDRCGYTFHSHISAALPVVRPTVRTSTASPSRGSKPSTTCIANGTG